MTKSQSWIMEYHRRPCGGMDRVGGLPDHLPHAWPRCQLCQEKMAFVGQLYAKDWFPLDSWLTAQFYVCDECRESFPQSNDEVPIHMELLPKDAPKNIRKAGVRSKRQPAAFISYTPIEDSMDQWEFNRKHLSEEELADKHLRRDKIGGLFPYDGYEGPRITPKNRMIAQFLWKGIGGPIYLFQSEKDGIYLHYYR